MITADSLGTYGNAMACIAELATYGIEADVTMGGISIHAQDVEVQADGTAINQIELAKIVVTTFGGRVCENGRTGLMGAIAQRWE